MTNAAIVDFAFDEIDRARADLLRKQASES